MENIDVFDVLLKLTLGSISIILFGVWKVREHLRVFSINIFIKENKAFWIWSLIMVYTLLFIVTIHPPAAEAIKTMIGLDVNGEPTSFLMLGWGLSVMVNGLNPNKLDKKPPL
jgi:hypothetical protein